MHRLMLSSSIFNSISDKKSSDSNSSISISFSTESKIKLVLYPKSLKNEIKSFNERYLLAIPFVS